MNRELELAYDQLWSWCRQHNFAGYDPYDALNSRLFQATPLKQSRTARLVWTQLAKRSQVNLRRLALVPAERNAKGTALFALAALSTYRRLQTKEAEIEARELLDDLLAMQLSGVTGAAWGYNFPWQSRSFFAPRGTPTIVPTAFAARALVEASDALKDETYLRVARKACDFFLQDLSRTDERNGSFCFSYSPNSSTRIYNASLLAAEILASVSALTGEKPLCEMAIRAARYVVDHQQENGSWSYGAEKSQAWVDNFHSGFVLTSLNRIIEACNPARANGFSDSLRHGYNYWRTSFFLADGRPKYYDDGLYPADTHAAATAIVTLCELYRLDTEALLLAERIALWTVRHLQDRRGFFYYQQRRFLTVRTPFMRWSQAWMLYALARLWEERS